MQTLDLSRSLAPVINLTDVPTLEAMLRASTCERTKITIDHVTDSGVMVLPVRIIDGMDDIMERGTISEAQERLVYDLFDLLRSSPRLAM